MALNSLGPRKHRRPAFRDALYARLIYHLPYPGPFTRRLSVGSQMVEQGQRVGFAAAELRRHVEYRRGLGNFAVQAPYGFRCQR